MRERAVFNVVIGAVTTILLGVLTLGIMLSAYLPTVIDGLSSPVQAKIWCDSAANNSCYGTWPLPGGEEGSGEVIGAREHRDDGHYIDIVLDEDGEATVPGIWEWRLLLARGVTAIATLLLAALAVGLVRFRPHMRVLIGQRRRHGRPIRQRLAEASAAQRARRSGRK